MSVVILFVTFLIANTIDAIVPYANSSSESPYSSGYNHGCDDAGISDPSDRYINQPEKGPSFHTNEFMRGYNDGYDACSDNGASTSSNGEVENGLTVKVRLAGDFEGRAHVKIMNTGAQGSGWVHDTIVFEHQDIEEGERFRVDGWLEYGGDRESVESVNGPEHEPEGIMLFLYN